MKGQEKRTKIVDFTDDGIPIILCKAKNRRRSCGLSRVDWRFYCEYCKCFHNHGDQPGHRVAHCRRNTPFDVKGYAVFEVCSDKTICPPCLPQAHA